MTTVLIFLAFGLINWFGTLLIVESKIFEPMRRFVGRRYANSTRKIPVTFWSYVDTLVTCHMCAGTWVGFALALFAPLVFGSGWVGFVLVGLLIKALGHLVLVVHKLGEELASRAKWDRVRIERDIRNSIADRRAGVRKPAD